jgi:solute:Na+ symporter, SSS family
MDVDFAKLGFDTNFGVLDWCIVVGYLIAIVSIGVYIRKYIASATDFMVAGRGLKTFLAIATMIGTELGLVTVMYSSQKGFTGGFAAFHIAFAAAIVTLFVGLSGFIVVPLRRLKVMTIPEFYEKRFGKDVRILGGIILALSGILNMGMFLKAGSLFVTGVTGMTEPWELKIVMTVLLCMVLLYTTLGGMVSVAILDYIQFVVLSFSLLFASIMSIRFLGWTNIVDTVTREMGKSGFNPFDEAGFGWSYVLWMFFMGLVSCAVWQTAVIRACSAKSTRIVKRIYTLSSVGFLIRFLIPYFFGICALVFIANNETLHGVFLSAEGKANSDLRLTAMPFYLSQILPAGFIGIICAGMLAAFMSTHDSYLLCWSSVLTQDVVAPWFKKDLSSRTRLLLTRIFIVGIGIFILVWGLWYPLEQDLWDYMAISGSIYSIGGFALLAFGLYWKRASRVGAYLALSCGFLATFGLTVVQNKFEFLFLPTKRLFGFTREIPIDELAEDMRLVKEVLPDDTTALVYDVISSDIVGLVALCLAIVLMIVGSLLFPDKRQNAYHAEREES